MAIVSHAYCEPAASSAAKLAAYVPEYCSAELCLSMAEPTGVGIARPWIGTVHTYGNWEAFNCYTRELAPADALLLQPLVAIEEHRSANGPPLPAVINLANGQQFHVRSVPCRRHNCRRCNDLIGGWVFPYVSPKWTPRAAYPSPDTHRLQTEPWPHGLTGHSDGGAKALHGPAEP